MIFSRKFAGCRLPLFLILLFASCTTIDKRTDLADLNGPGINVALLTNAREVSLAGRELKVIANGKELTYGRSAISVYYTLDGFLIDGRLVKSGRLAIEGKEIRVNKRAYRGRISIYREGESLTVVNSLGLESYLMGIINHEISSWWPLESVKAQAVAARTYAYQKLKSDQEDPYHVKASVMDQVYGGSGAEDSRVQSAVNATRGEILFYEEEVARALYHSTCGGYTESAVNVWGRDFPYLRTVKDPYCTDAPHYFWSYRTDFESLLKSLYEKGIIVGEEPGTIKVLKKSERGRVKKISIAGVVLSGDNFRALAGYENIKSTLFTVEKRRNEIIFSGSGSGHGVGMCQWGARGMALDGMNYKAILKHYYSGTHIKKVY